NRYAVSVTASAALRGQPRVSRLDELRERVAVEPGDPERRERLGLRLHEEEAQLRVVDGDGRVLEERLDEGTGDGVVVELPERGLHGQREQQVLALDLHHGRAAQ